LAPWALLAPGAPLAGHRRGAAAAIRRAWPLGTSGPWGSSRQGVLIAPLTAAAACLPLERRAAQRAIGPILNVVMKAQVALPLLWLCHTFAPACPATQGGEVERATGGCKRLFAEQRAGMWRWDEDHAEVGRRRPGEPGRMPCLCRRHRKLPRRCRLTRRCGLRFAAGISVDPPVAGRL